MSASAEINESKSIECLMFGGIRLSHVREEMPKSLRFMSLSYELQEFKKAKASRLHNYENEIEDHFD